MKRGLGGDGKLLKIRRTKEVVKKKILNLKVIL